MDRRAGADAYGVAVERLREGEIVGVYPEATISRSFELKDFKSGAIRMAQDAHVPIVPLIVWGAQRVWTKDHPKNLGRKKTSDHRGGRTAIRTFEVGPGGADATARDDDRVCSTRSRRTTRIPQASTGCRTDSAVAHRPWTEASAIEEAELIERARRRAESS